MIDLEHVMERLGRIMTGDSTLDVRIRGDRAYARPGVVVLPALEHFECLGVDGAERIIHGCGDHEFGHAADSDFEIVASANRESKAYGYLLNALEDGYVEGRRGVLYPGARYNLAKKNAWFWDTDFSAAGGHRSCVHRIGDLGRPLWERFLLGLTMIVRPYGGQTIEAVEAVDADVAAMLREIEPLLAELPPLYDRSKQTAEVERLARAIWEVFVEEAEEPGDDASPEGGAPSPDDGNEAPGGEGGQQQLDFDRPASRGQRERPKFAGEADFEIERFNTEPCEPMNPEEAVQARVSKTFEVPEELRPYVVFDQSFDVERDFSGEWTDQLSAAYEVYKAEAESVTDELVYAFEAALRDRTRRRLSFDGDEEGEIDSMLLPAFSLGAARPEDLWIDYHAEEEGGHAAVAILIDCSGSMGNGKMAVVNPRTKQLEESPSKSYLARLCAIAAHDALQRCQVPHEINGFTTLVNTHVGVHPWTPGRVPQYVEHFKRLGAVCDEARARGTDLMHFARTWWPDGELQVPIYGTFKGFGHEDGRGLVLIAGIAANLDGEAILWQARRLARRPERRKVMVVLSDGYPAGSHDNAQGSRYLAEAVQRALGAGIEVYGIGIQSSAVKEFYPHWWVVNRLDQLPAVMIRALMETVVDVGSSAAWIP